jgi:hypothetical protein
VSFETAVIGAAVLATFYLTAIRGSTTA